jgi:hypothetical protein
LPHPAETNNTAAKKSTKKLLNLAKYKLYFNRFMYNKPDSF